jgi:hypothetical protein
VLVLTGKGRAAEAALSQEGVPVYDDLQALARALIADHTSDGSNRA